MPDWLVHLDRRWIFTATFLAVGIPTLLGLRFPEQPSKNVLDVYKAIEDLPAGSTVLLTLDFDPASEGELGPMASAFTRHCCEKKLKIVYLTLWDRGPSMIQKAIDIIRTEYPAMKYGQDYVNLGYKSGAQGVIKNMGTNLRADFQADVEGTSLEKLPLTKSLHNLKDMRMIICVGAGSPGPKEWVQFGAATYNLKAVAGATGVQAPQLGPYIPTPLLGVLAAIKGAAEYEQALIEGYPHLKKIAKAQEGLRRMGPQFVAHLLIVGLIILGNIISFSQRRRATP